MKRKIYLRAGTAPANRTIYVYLGTQWIGLAVGPGKPDIMLTDSLLFTQAAWTGNNGPLTSYVDFSVPGVEQYLTFAMSAAARTSGPVIQLPCRIYDTEARATVALSGSNSVTLFVAPHIYVNCTEFEGSPSVNVDNGAPLDTDGDGIDDAQDTDDDGDGRPDDSDDFPLDPDEKDDFDGDGVGDNEDTDDDNDGIPDTTDDAPQDPDVSFIDSDGDGVGDSQDAFPNNPREDKDTDGDGVGDNQDPDDTTPPAAPEDPPAGDGSGNPGTGDGGGGPGPVPLPGDPGTGTGTAGTGDTSGKILPGAGHDVAGRAVLIGPAIQGKLGTFSPLSVSAVPRATTAAINFTTPVFGSFNYTIDFSASPWTHIRALLLIIVIYLMGRSLLTRFTV